MKKTSLLTISLMSFVLTLASCAPQAFVVSPEMRKPSKSGLNLAGKSMAVVYLADDSTRDTSFNAALTDGFATRLEEEYFGGEQMVQSFKMQAKMDADYADKDSLINLVMDSGCDVVFLFDIPQFGNPVSGDPVKLTGRVAPDSAYVSNVTVPFTTKIYVYDSMNKDDKVLSYTGSKDLKQQVFFASEPSKSEIASKVWTNIASAADNAGYKAAASFMSQWESESYSVIYYDGCEPAWDKGAQYAYSFKWKEAIEQWLTLVNSKNAEKRSCAAYDVALGCFMMGQPSLALEWLDRSDKDVPVSLSKSLRAKIKEYTGK